MNTHYVIKARIESTINNQSVDAHFLELSESDLKFIIKKNNWLFDWSKELYHTKGQYLN